MKRYKFKVGDRVKYVGDHAAPVVCKGDKGKVVMVEGLTSCVEWNHRHPEMHDGENGGWGSGSCWWVINSCLELIPFHELDEILGL